MPEQLDLPIPDQTVQGDKIVETTSYKMATIHLDFDAGTIIVGLRGDMGIVRSESIGDAKALLTQLNVSDFSARSLISQVFDMLAKFNRLDGSISGKPYSGDFNA